MNERQFKNIVKKTINEALIKEQMYDIVRGIVKEEYDKYMNRTMLSEKDNKDVSVTMANRLKKMMKNDKFNQTELAQIGFPNMSRRGASSYFSKCLKGERDFPGNSAAKIYKAAVDK